MASVQQKRLGDQVGYLRAYLVSLRTDTALMPTVPTTWLTLLINKLNTTHIQLAAGTKNTDTAREQLVRYTNFAAAGTGIRPEEFTKGLDLFTRVNGGQP
jgi:hypothetical protein